MRVLFLIVYVVYFYLFRAFFFDSLRRFCDGCFKVFVSRFRYLCYVGVGVVVFFYFKGVFWFLELRVIVYRFSDVGCYVMDFGFYWFVRFSSFFWYRFVFLLLGRVGVRFFFFCGYGVGVFYVCWVGRVLFSLVYFRVRCGFVAINGCVGRSRRGFGLIFSRCRVFFGFRGYVCFSGWAVLFERLL